MYLVEVETIEGDWVPALAKHVEHTNLCNAFWYALRFTPEYGVRIRKLNGYRAGECIRVVREEL